MDVTTTATEFLRSQLQVWKPFGAFFAAVTGIDGCSSGSYWKAPVSATGASCRLRVLDC